MCLTRETSSTNPTTSSIVLRHTEIHSRNHNNKDIIIHAPPPPPPSSTFSSSFNGHFEIIWVPKKSAPKQNSLESKPFSSSSKLFQSWKLQIVVEVEKSRIPVLLQQTWKLFCSCLLQLLLVLLQSSLFLPPWWYNNNNNNNKHHHPFFFFSCLATTNTHQHIKFTSKKS